MTTYYRVHPKDEDPNSLLDPDNHKSRPWGADESVRAGVSVFPDENHLYRYLVNRNADLEDSVLVELEGTESVDEDFDADEGALLVHPTRIVDVRPLDIERVRALAGS